MTRTRQVLPLFGFPFETPALCYVQTLQRARK
jgi:hypothetical protein